jgi:methyl-accepting chemotaxis protein
VQAIAEIGAVIARINEFTNTIASAVEEQTATTNEIRRNVGEASRGSSEIAASITSVAEVARGTVAGAGEAQRAAAELSRMAGDLQKLVAQFKSAGVAEAPDNLVPFAAPARAAA